MEIKNADFYRENASTIADERLNMIKEDIAKNINSDKYRDKFSFRNGYTMNEGQYEDLKESLDEFKSELQRKGFIFTYNLDYDGGFMSNMADIMSGKAKKSKLYIELKW